MKHLPKLRDRDGSTRKRYLCVAIDGASRYVHLTVKDNETSASAVAFLTDVLDAFPFRVTHVLTDRGSCFTADAFEAPCTRHGLQHRKSRSYTPKTNGMVERFNGRMQREVLGIMIYSHRDLEVVLRGFNAAYNGRRQRVLNGLSPEMVLRQLRRTASRGHPGHRRHLRRGAWPAAALAVQRPPRRALLSADPRL